MKAIKWTNKFSGESGYVESLADNHFVNTWEIENAAKFRTKKDAEKAVGTLNEFGEDANNNFEIVDMPKAAAPKKAATPKKAAAPKKAATKTAAKTATSKAATTKTADKETAVKADKAVAEKKPAAKKPAAKVATKTTAAKKTAKA